MYIGKFHKFKVAGICVAGIQDGHLSYIVNAASDALIKKGYKVLIFNSFSDFYNDSPFISGESSIYQLINFELLDVLVVFPETIKSTRITDEIIKQAAEHNTPVISVDGECEGSTNIVYDYAGGFEEIVRHVVEHHGCTDTYMVAGMRTNKFSEERIAAYKKVLSENNIPFDEKRLGYGDFWSEPTRRLMSDFFENNERIPQAFICANDTMAITVARYLREKGYRVPEDVIVTGFDATYTDRYFSSSEITSALLDINELAELIARTADGYFEGTETPKTKTINFRTVPAHSCGCVKVDREFINEKFLKMDDYTAATQANETYMSEYSAHTVNCKTLDEITTEMAHYADYLSWICINNDFLTPDFKSSSDGFDGIFSRTMIAIMQRQWDMSIKNQVFESRMLLPDLGKALKLYNKLMFVPLHFQASVIGYYGVVIDNFEIGSNALYDTRRFVNNTNQILENFKNKYRLQCAYDALETTHSLDPMTSIYNRAGFFNAAKRIINNSEPQEFLMISIDMDSLKEINDKYGHSDGDEAICEVAKAIKSVCKDKSICARFGGDEFVVAMPFDGEEHIVPRIVGDIQTHIDCFNRASDKDYEVSISVGAKHGIISNFYDLGELIKKSDHEMYEQKRIKKGVRPSTLPSVNAGADSIGVYEKRIHDILSSGKDSTYFYMSYENSKWYIMQNENTPKCMVSSSVGPLRSIWLSGTIYADDVSIFNEFALKIRKAFNEGITQKELTVSIRLVEDEVPVWYNIFAILCPAEDGRLSEMAGKIRRASSYEIMQMEIQNYYTTTDNPLMITENIKSLVHNNKGKKYVFIHFDIKRFKFINETYGEEIGTDLLYHISRQLKIYCEPDQLSARLNSDIFLLLTPYETKDDIYRIIREVEKNISGFRNIKYEFAFGVYIADDLTLPPRVMGDRASIARQSVKNNAIENIAFYDDNMLQNAQTRKFVESSMNSALENQQFSIYLQPKFSISRKEAVGYEALVRWIHPERGMISPGDFIPLFEENGFILKLDAYVWECACQVLRDWIDRGLDPLPISVNVSRAHLKDDTFIKTLDRLIKKYRLSKELLELEITESVDGADSMAMTQEIKNHGYTLLMDDFGSGYSSLNTLKSTKFDVLKIDREFLSSFMSSERGKKIISHTISMSQDVGLDLIAEGVETLEQADFLESCGCDTAQGFYYAKPMPVQDAEAYLIKKQ